MRAADRECQYRILDIGCDSLDNGLCQEKCGLDLHGLETAVHRIHVDVASALEEKRVPRSVVRVVAAESRAHG